MRCACRCGSEHGQSYRCIAAAYHRALSHHWWTVPIYQATCAGHPGAWGRGEMTQEDLLSTIEEQAKDGADFMTLHCGVTLDAIQRMAGRAV